MRVTPRCAASRSACSPTRSRSALVTVTHGSAVRVSRLPDAFGRQVRSFEADLEIPGVAGGPVRAVFIRAPWIDEHGDAVEVLAAVDGHVVAARQDNMLVISFHPEIAGEDRLHALFLESL